SAGGSARGPGGSRRKARRSANARRWASKSRACAERADALLVRSVRLGFLGVWPFGREGPAVGGWIPLDFLGFSRPNRDFSMGYTDFHGKNFLLPFSAWPGNHRNWRQGFGMRKRGIVHGASLSRLLIFCKELSPGPFPSGRLLRDLRLL